MNRGAIVLCGGGSQRMGRDKANLAFGDRTLLGRVVQVVERSVPAERIVCVAAAGQCLPPLDRRIRVLRDRVRDAGPVPAVRAGLAELRGECDAALAVACDTPLLRETVVETLFAAATDSLAVAVTLEDRGLQPLPAVYPTDPRVYAHQASQPHSLRGLLGCAKTRLLTQAEMEELDPRLLSFLNCNDPESLRLALQMDDAR